MIRNTTLQTIVDFGDLPIFQAIAYPCIAILRNIEPNDDSHFKAFNVDDIEVVERLGDTVHTEAWLQSQSSLDDGSWQLTNPQSLKLLQKIRDSGVPLENYANGQIHMGVKTGLNQAFVINEPTRNRLIREDPKSAEIIRPWLRGRDIKRWAIDWQRIYIIFAYHGVDITRYPAIEAYLKSFKVDLLNRATSNNHAWYELQQPQMGIYHLFDAPKIVYPHFGTETRFVHDAKGFYSNDRTYITIASFWLLGLLNSSVVNFFMRQIAPAVRGDYMEFRIIYVSQIPIPTPTDTQCAAIEAIVQQLLDLEGQGPEVPALEAELNRLVYEVYGLTDTEIRLIEDHLEKKG